MRPSPESVSRQIEVDTYEAPTSRALSLSKLGPPEQAAYPGWIRRSWPTYVGPHEVNVEWDDLIRDLDRLQEATIEKDGKRVATRTHVEGQVGRVFQAAGIALPANWREHPA